MKISKLLNRNYLSILLIFFALLFADVAAEEEPVDIWNIENQSEKQKSQINSEEISASSNTVSQIDVQQNNQLEVIKKSELESGTINLAGIYDPEEHGLSMDMWFNSDGNEIILMIDKLNKIKLSKDAKEILNIALLTNSYFPQRNIYIRLIRKNKLNLFPCKD